MCIDGGCSGWRAQAEPQAGHSHGSFEAQSVSQVRIKIAGDYTWSPLHSLSLSLYIYIYICVCMYVYIYIYIYT